MGANNAIGITNRSLPCRFYARPAIFVAEVEDLQSNAYHHEYGSDRYRGHTIVCDPEPQERRSDDKRDPWRRRTSNVQHFPSTP